MSKFRKVTEDMNADSSSRRIPLFYQSIDASSVQDCSVWSKQNNEARGPTCSNLSCACKNRRQSDKHPSVRGNFTKYTYRIVIPEAPDKGQSIIDSQYDDFIYPRLRTNKGVSQVIEYLGGRCMNSHSGRCFNMIFGAIPSFSGCYLDIGHGQHHRHNTTGGSQKTKEAWVSHCKTKNRISLCMYDEASDEHLPYLVRENTPGAKWELDSRLQPKFEPPVHVDRSSEKQRCSNCNAQKQAYVMKFGCVIQSVTICKAIPPCPFCDTVSVWTVQINEVLISNDQGRTEAWRGSRFASNGIDSLKQPWGKFVLDVSSPGPRSSPCETPPQHLNEAWLQRLDKASQSVTRINLNFSSVASRLLLLAKLLKGSECSCGTAIQSRKSAKHGQRLKLIANSVVQVARLPGFVLHYSALVSFENVESQNLKALRSIASVVGQEILTDCVKMHIVCPLVYVVPIVQPNGYIRLNFIFRIGSLDGSADSKPTFEAVDALHIERRIEYWISNANMSGISKIPVDLDYPAEKRLDCEGMMSALQCLEQQARDNQAEISQVETDIKTLSVAMESEAHQISSDGQRRVSDTCNQILELWGDFRLAKDYIQDWQRLLCLIMLKTGVLAACSAELSTGSNSTPKQKINLNASAIMQRMGYDGDNSDSRTLNGIDKEQAKNVGEGRMSAKKRSHAMSCAHDIGIKDHERTKKLLFDSIACQIGDFDDNFVHKQPGCDDPVCTCKVPPGHRLGKQPARFQFGKGQYQTHVYNIESNMVNNTAHPAELESAFVQEYNTRILPLLKSNILIKKVASFLTQQCSAGHAGTFGCYYMSFPSIPNYTGLFLRGGGSEGATLHMRHSTTGGSTEKHKQTCLSYCRSTEKFYFCQYNSTTKEMEKHWVYCQDENGKSRFELVAGLQPKFGPPMYVDRSSESEQCDLCCTLKHVTKRKCFQIKFGCAQQSIRTTICKAVAPCSNCAIANGRIHWEIRINGCFVNDGRIVSHIDHTEKNQHCTYSHDEWDASLSIPNIDQ